MSQRETSTTGAAAKQPASPILVIITTVLVLSLLFTTLLSPVAGLLSFLALVFGFQLLLWVVPTVLTYRNLRIPADPAGEPFDETTPDLPEPVATALRSNVPILESLEFLVAGCRWRSTSSSFYSRGFSTLLLNRKSQQSARIATFVQRRKGHETILQVVGFATEFTDGTTLGTSNNPNPTLSRAGLREGSMAFPEVADPRRLYEIHQATLAAYCGDGIRRDLSRIDPDRYQAEIFVREMTKLAEAGYYRLDDEQREYRPTLKCVVRLNALTRWPIRSILKKLADRKRARLLRELGLDGPERTWTSDLLVDQRVV